MSLTNWEAFGDSDWVHETDKDGNRLIPAKPELERGQFVARYRSSRCCKCNLPIFPGDVVAYTPNSHRIRHVNCIRSHSTTSQKPTNSEEMGRPVLAERPIYTERKFDV